MALRSVISRARVFWALFWRGRASGRRRPDFVQMACENVLEELKAERLMKDASPVMRSLEGKRDLKLHLGCGSDLRAGWVNIDLNGDRYSKQAETTTPVLYFDWDL